MGWRGADVTPSAVVMETTEGGRWCGEEKWKRKRKNIKIKIKNEERLGRIVEGSVVVWRGDVSRSGSVWVGRREWEEEEEGQREKKIIKSI